ncbi:MULTISPECIES: ParA family protein [unclassified Imperialibacter]|uniref:ParA family protein n=1 Tax=unclassified Imperialibacter TaxID=2629706 RepID=UPI0012587A10|nr:MULTISPECIES: AAA family ATPase [unclassified Imperialibacter]CAD5282362.1 Chromosome partitioning protein [Imperialibacter sp. 75]CAD5291924.1 Chromosome partitioning protein [Imperialibacter sp. 89]VVT28068.1 Sporulation initiation inhibitor protein Soj [Imperialibacter sp. EC-SDR9]
MKTIVFFNNKGEVGKTTLVYHFTYMLAELGYKSLAIDLDPQANLTSMFLSDSRLQEIYDNELSRPTILESIRPLNRGTSDIQIAHIENINDKIGLLAGDLELSLFEDKLSSSWGNCLNRDEAAFRIVSSFYRVIAEANHRFGADFNIIDIGPNFGAINRATLIAADYVIVPMAADLFSLQGLKNLGNRLEDWHTQWEDRVSRNPEPTLALPKGDMKPLGYVIMQHGIKESRPVKSYLKWANRIPQVFRQFVLKDNVHSNIAVENDEYCIALLKHYHSLIPMAMEARKPIFLLKPSEGAIGAHLGAVRNSYSDFKALTEKILSIIGS